jgi:hypothetical protein
MVTIEIGASRATMLKLAADIQAAFADAGEGQSVELEGESNDSSSEPVTVRFSNDDMERPEVAEAVYVEIERD